MSDGTITPMNIVTDQTPSMPSVPNLAAKYRAAHQHRLMLLSKIKGEVPTRHEFCHILAVETAAPNLWITVRFLDDSRKGLQPGNIRLATQEEEHFSQSAELR